MKPLILSFFLVLLGVSLLTQEEEQPISSTPILETSGDFEIQTTIQTPDSIVQLWDKSVIAYK